MPGIQTEDEAQQFLHVWFRQLVRRALDIVLHGIGPALSVKLARGWRSPWTRKFYRASMRLADRIGQAHPALAKEARDLLTLATVVADLERELFPTWFGWWLEELEAEGAIRYNTAKNRLEVCR